MLLPLAAAVFPVAAFNWFMTVLRLVTDKLGAIVWGSAVSDVVVIGLAWVLAPHGLGAAALAWPIGGSAGAAVVGVSAIRALRRRSLATH